MLSFASFWREVRAPQKVRVAGINTVDVIAIQRFFLGNSTGIANTGKYQFNPASTTYSGISGSQTGQNYNALVFGDIATPFAP